MQDDYLGQKLCIFISKNDKYEGIVLYELLLEIAFNSRLSGGTVTIGDKGFFGAQDESTKLKILRSSENLPVVLEFQGRVNRIERYIERIQPMIKEGLLTRTDVRITKFNSPEETSDEIKDEGNEDQSQIFEEDIEKTATPDSQPQNQAFTLDEDESDAATSDAEAQDEAFKMPDEGERIEEVIVKAAEPQVEIPSFDEADTSEPLEAAPHENPEDVTTETPDYQQTNDETAGPDFHFSDDEQTLDGDEGDSPEPVADSFIDEEDEDGEEEKPVLQLADLSATQDDDHAIPDDNFGDTQDQFQAETLEDSEFSKPQPEDIEEALNDLDNEEFANSFDEVLKKASTDEKDGGDNGQDDNPLKNYKKSVDEEDPIKTDEDDKNHSDDEIKNYFSSLFKK